ncbi:hypothetical protein IFM89_004078 [Coptis chinensis]|uniref:UDP-N-acetylmuramate dehydrogenase n=1 Tax=Coptis chinensis TaxID=261450 RepID=A0A835H4F9_9MAGN|nr:hypothetical protein IFM89_004078 [Coptis chinensis]
MLLACCRYCCEHSIRFLIVGKGSNCLFDDNGFDGCVILNRIEFIERIEPGVYRVGSGYPFNRLGLQCCNEGFSGLEFAGGIPGTVGGAAYMNAGANGQIVLPRYERLSSSSCRYIPSETFSVSEGATTGVLGKAEIISASGERSAGSVFQNPSGFSAAEFIEKAGLKGFRRGGAKVSEIHANFFINCGSATSTDMLELINLVKVKVNSKFGIELKEEVKYVSACNGLISNRNDSFSV